MNAETVGDAVDIGVVADDLGDMQDVDVGMSGGSQRRYVLRDHLPRSPGQLQRIAQHREASIIQTGRFEVVFDPTEKIIIFEEATQTAPMMGESVVTVIGGAHHQRDQLPIDLAQRLGALHRLGV